ncbi:S-adenosyl-L-methionine-dependent methyltransferase [Dactylonectria estremocensis]|uniref:S-adenosyl-L-methionine-dependent methyltransferase n=1 Tax=Dactylonectria estremocensis TaxID=1079267 RepID=A0A9P9IPB7_9HYPO|nr:S-adenosyl-L-methionine-dependent methyltransferase [Dactylonectria estremocensis]
MTQDSTIRPDSSPSRSPTSAKSPLKPRSPAAEDPQTTPAPLQEETLEADPALDEGEASDAGYDTDAASSASTSISSSVRDYAFENSRRYHKFQEGRYQFPNDEPEQEREDMKHSMIVNLCKGKLHFAPLHNPQSVLDIGTGTGIWAVDMGDEYPEADVLGIDLSPIQPSWVPPNVRFIVDDAEAEWLHAPESLDYIHIRHMTSSIRDWSKLVSQAYRALKPGGWIEVQELRFVLKCDDGTLRPDSQVLGFLNNVKDGLAAFNVDLLGMEKNQQRVKDAGFVNVDEQVLKVPLGVWPRDKKMKTIGLYNRCMIYDGLHGISMGPFTRGLKWAPEEVEVYLVGVRKELMDSSQHGYIPFHVVTGQKPE